MASTNLPVALGYIGTGIAARDLHWPAISQLDNKFRIQAVCNRTRSKAEEFASLTHATSIYDSTEELLCDQAVEAVVISAPIELNYSLLKLALESGKHILVEKPLAASLAEATELVDLVAHTDKVCLLAENFRYHPAFVKIKELMTEGVIGQVSSFFWNGYSCLLPGDKYATAWRLKNQYPGGYVMDGGIHNVAAIRTLFGEMKTFKATTHAINPEIGTIDTLNALFTLDNNVTGQLNLCFSASGFRENRLVILGSKGTIVFENEIVTVTHGATNEISSISPNDFFDSYRLQFNDFYHCIRDGKQPVSTFEQGLYDLKFMMQLIG